jgi:hypothetical protein
MAKSVEEFEAEIKEQGFATAGSARAAVTRSELPKGEKKRLHELVESSYASAEELQGPNAQDIRRTPPKVNDFKANGAPPGLDRLAFNVALYAAQHTLKVPDVLKQIAARVSELT